MRGFLGKCTDRRESIGPEDSRIEKVSSVRLLYCNFLRSQPPPKTNDEFEPLLAKKSKMLTIFRRKVNLDFLEK